MIDPMNTAAVGVPSPSTTDVADDVATPTEVDAAEWNDEFAAAAEQFAILSDANGEVDSALPEGRSQEDVDALTGQAASDDASSGSTDQTQTSDVPDGMSMNEFMAKTYADRLKNS